MDIAREAEIKDRLLKTFLNQIVNRHILPDSRGTLTAEIQRLADESGIPVDELGTFLRDHLPQSGMMVISSEASRILTGSCQTIDDRQIPPEMRSHP